MARKLQLSNGTKIPQPVMRGQTPVERYQALSGGAFHQDEDEEGDYDNVGGPI